MGLILKLQTDVQTLNLSNNLEVISTATHPGLIFHKTGVSVISYSDLERKRFTAARQFSVCQFVETPKFSP